MTTARKKVKVIRAANGCYRYLLVRQQCPFFLSKAHYRTVGDAKSAGKAKARLLGPVTGPLHIQIRGLCIDCLYHGIARQAARLENTDRPSVLCRSCHEERHPGHLERSGVA